MPWGTPRLSMHLKSSLMDTSDEDHLSQCYNQAHVLKYSHIRTPLLELCLVCCALKNGYKKACVYKIFMKCSIYDTHAKFNIQHNWRDLVEATPEPEEISPLPPTWHFAFKKSPFPCFSP